MLWYPCFAYPLTGYCDPFAGRFSVLSLKIGVRGSIGLTRRGIIIDRRPGVHIYWWLLIRSGVLVRDAYNDCAGEKSPRDDRRGQPTVIMAVRVIVGGITMVP